MLFFVEENMVHRIRVCQTNVDQLCLSIHANYCLMVQLNYSFERSFRELKTSQLSIKLITKRVLCLSVSCDRFILTYTDFE